MNRPRTNGVPTGPTTCIPSWSSLARSAAWGESCFLGQLGEARAGTWKERPGLEEQDCTGRKGCSKAVVVGEARVGVPALNGDSSSLGSLTLLWARPRHGTVSPDAACPGCKGHLRQEERFSQTLSPGSLSGNVSLC